MIRLKETKFSDITQFYTDIKASHITAHGVEYTAHHYEIFNCASECTSYRELGVMQGATAAAAVVAGYKNIHLIDIDLSEFTPYAYLFEASDADVYSEQKSSINFGAHELSRVDFLLIDSLHAAKHLKLELAIHASKVNKYILFHDTLTKKSLQRVIEKFISDNVEQWQLVEYYQKNVGYTLIKRIEN